MILSRLATVRLFCRALLAVAASALVFGTASAQLHIQPVVVAFGATQRIASVTVSLDPHATEPMLLQADVLSWSQGLGGESVSVDTDDLLVVPPMAELKPGDTQVFRIALRGGRQRSEEVAYRLILEDVAVPAAEAADTPGMGVSFRMRHDLPVLLAPVGQVVNQFRWKSCPSAAAQACVRVVNAGNQRVSLRSLTLVGDGWEQTLPFEIAQTVLAGTEREWLVPLAPGQLGPLRGLRVLSARGETLEAETVGL